MSRAEALRQGMLALMAQARGAQAYPAHPSRRLRFPLVGEGGETQVTTVAKPNADGWRANQCQRSSFRNNARHWERPVRISSRFRNASARMFGKLSSRCVVSRYSIPSSSQW